jgi:hypothetical protein
LSIQSRCINKKISKDIRSLKQTKGETISGLITKSNSTEISDENKKADSSNLIKALPLEMVKLDLSDGLFLSNFEKQNRDRDSCLLNIDCVSKFGSVDNSHRSRFEFDKLWVLTKLAINQKIKFATDHETEQRLASKFRTISKQVDQFLTRLGQETVSNNELFKIFSFNSDSFFI